ncbi:U1 small nuclear ribonucleoprotein C-like [Phyllostomus hastatus]|uniref:U1 small nuclear ribonucleoprotein C-like n=1 Tax=Phyllostomus hastatus TaxID=9423 RepID=UPI001E6843BB|nr:U1 small nuclear ribonucleoprotein C-like [Phyllostomus hastatus]
MYLTRDSPSVRRTQCSGRKHKEDVKDCSQKWMEEQAQSLTDKTPGPPRPGMMPAPHMVGPPMMPMMSPSPPGYCQLGPASRMRPQIGGHMPVMPEPPRQDLLPTL